MGKCAVYRPGEVAVLAATKWAMCRALGLPADWGPLLGQAFTYGLHGADTKNLAMGGRAATYCCGTLCWIWPLQGRAHVCGLVAGAETNQCLANILLELAANTH